MPSAKTQQRKDFAESLRREMERKRGWKGRGAATELAKAVGAKPSLVASWLRGERIPSGTYLTRIMTVLGIGAAALERPERAPAAPQDDGSPGKAPVVAIGEPGVSYAKQTTGPGLAAWLALGAEMQHNLAIDIFKKALEAQDFVGSPVLRAMHGIAQKMDEMGYTAMSRHIWAEMGKYFGNQLPPEKEP
jgi:transcriptional regulator with XRE-family HTH domain